MKRLALRFVGSVVLIGTMGLWPFPTGVSDRPAYWEGPRTATGTLECIGTTDGRVECWTAMDYEQLGAWFDRRADSMGAPGARR